jgi:hypothetical protein
MGETYNNTLIALTIILLIVIVAGSLTYTSYSRRKFFQTNIANMTEVNKCFYICDYEFNSGSTYFDGYKFCVEKCDRISERNCVEDTNG